MTNRQALLLSVLTAAATCCAVLIQAHVLGKPVWIEAGLGALFYPPLAINAWIDARRHVLLKNWTHLSGLIALVALIWVGASGLALAAAAIVALAMLAVSRLTGGRLMGAGDARLIVVLALWNAIWHPWGALVMIFASFVLHTLYILVRSFFRHVTLQTRHAFGPWLVAGSWLTFVFMP